MTKETQAQLKPKPLKIILEIGYIAPSGNALGKYKDRRGRWRTKITDERKKWFKLIFHHWPLCDREYFPVNFEGSTYASYKPLKKRYRLTIHRYCTKSNWIKDKVNKFQAHKPLEDALLPWKMNIKTFDKGTWRQRTRFDKHVGLGLIWDDSEEWLDTQIEQFLVETEKEQRTIIQLEEDV